MENAVVAVEESFVLDVKSGTVLIISSGRVLVFNCSLKARYLFCNRKYRLAFSSYRRRHLLSNNFCFLKGNSVSNTNVINVDMVQSFFRGFRTMLLATGLRKR